MGLLRKEETRFNLGEPGGAHDQRAPAVVRDFDAVANDSMGAGHLMYASSLEDKDSEMELFDSFILDAHGLKFERSSPEPSETVVPYIGVKETPVYVHVDTDTDWATVAPSIAGVFVALTVAILSVKIQKNQTRANISAFRHQWINDLRSCSADYFQTAFSMILRLETQEGYPGSNEYRNDYDKFINLTTRFEMLLSRDDEYTKDILELDQKVMDSLDLYNIGVDFKLATYNINKLKSLVRQELERAWDDVKSDVGFKSRKKKKIKPAWIKRILPSNVRLPRRLA